MLNLNGCTSRRFLEVRLFLCCILTVVATAGLARPVEAAGLYTHTYFVELAIEKLEAYGGYSDLVVILEKYVNIVNYGAIFPDLTYGGIDGDWAEAMHDTGDVNANYAMYLEFLTDKGYSKTDIPSQTGYFKEFLDDPNYNAVVPKFRASLINQVLQIFNHSPRTEKEEKEIAFLFGVIAHQEADASWHWNVPGWVGWETYAFAHGYNTCEFSWPFGDLNHPETCLDVILRNLDNNTQSITTSYLPDIQTVVYSASDDVNIPRPLCKGRTLPWACDQPGDDPIVDGQDQIQAMWLIQMTNGYKNIPWVNAVRNYIPGGLDYGSAFVAGAWMQTWDLLGYTGRFYAKPSATGMENCHSWEDACLLSYALNHSIPGQEIWVAAGVHTPTTAPTDRDATFKISFAEVYGGFGGFEDARDERDPAANVTILSGDIDSNDIDGDGDGILEIASGIRGNNSYHVVTGTIGSTLDGFVITAGNANVGNICPGFDCNCPGKGCGGGMQNLDAGTLITNVTFSGNAAIIGGGMFIRSSSGAGSIPTPTITSVTFIGNIATNGGGIFIDHSLASISNVTFSENSAGSDGGGIYFYSYKNVISHATFSGNLAGHEGGGVYAFSTPSGAPVQIRNSILWSNTAQTGAQAYSDDWGGEGSIYVESSVVQGVCPPGSVCGVINDTDPMLGTLGDNGGSTPTFPLLAGSSAIDAAADDYCLASIGMSGAGSVDQRGVSRPQGLDCDIGAYEADNLGPTFLSFTRHDPADSPTNADQLVFRAKFSENVHNVHPADLIISGTTATVSAIAMVSSSEYEITISGGDLPGLDGFVGLELAPGQDIADMGENPLPDGEPPIDETYEVSNAVLSLLSFTRQSPATSPTNADTLVFRATFSAVALYVDEYAFDVTGTTAPITLVTAVDSKTFDITVTGGDLADLNGVVGLNVSPGVEIGSLSGAMLPNTEPDIDETYTVDNIAPTGTSIMRQVPLNSPTNATAITFRITFGEGVQDVALDDFSLLVTGTVTGSINAVDTVSDSVYDVVITGVGGDGVMDLDIDPANDISDLAGNPLGSNPAFGTEQTYTIDNTFPIVIFGGNTIPAQGSAMVTGPTQITIEFSEEMLNDGSIDAVNNPVNYLLVEAGENLRFETASCADGLVIDDTEITVNSIQYDNNGGSGPFIATLNINYGVPLYGGGYRLFICGTTSIHDPAGNPLNGGESDAILEFAVIKVLPDTGFAPNRVTLLPEQPAEQAYADLGDLWLEIPRLGVQIPIVGVPLSAEGSWDVSWLGHDAGWLNGSTFPTHPGNSVLTGHVYDSSGNPGPFINLIKIKYGDDVIVHAWGALYIYDVREVLQVKPWSVPALLKNQELPWVTLVTCRGYNIFTNSYAYRVLVRAVLTDIK